MKYKSELRKIKKDAAELAGSQFIDFDYCDRDGNPTDGQGNLLTAAEIKARVQRPIDSRCDNSFEVVGV